MTDMKDLKGTVRDVDIRDDGSLALTLTALDPGEYDANEFKVLIGKDVRILTVTADISKGLDNTPSR